MRQLNGCSTPAPRSSAAKQWFTKLAQTMKNNLQVLSRIQLAVLRHKRAALSLACHALDPGHLLHSSLFSPPDEMQRQLQSRHCLCLLRRNCAIPSTAALRPEEWGKAKPEDCRRAYD